MNFFLLYILSCSGSSGGEASAEAEAMVIKVAALAMAKFLMRCTFAQV